METKIKNQKRNFLIDIRLLQVIDRKSRIICEFFVQGNPELATIWQRDLQNVFNILNNRHYLIYGEKFEDYSSLMLWYKHMEPF